MLRKLLGVLVLFTAASVEAVLLDEGGHELNVMNDQVEDYNNNLSVNDIHIINLSHNNSKDNKRLTDQDSGIVPSGGDSAGKMLNGVPQPLSGPNHCTMDGLFCLPANYSKYVKIFHVFFCKSDTQISHYHKFLVALKATFIIYPESQLENKTWYF